MGAGLPSVAAVASRAYSGELPERYRSSEDPFRATFRACLAERLCENQTILDVGSGRSPTLSAGERPRGVSYVGLDILRGELELASPGSYDSILARDITIHDPTLDQSFDLILSFQALEHVRRLDAALENMRQYLQPGGHLVAQMSGTFSVFGLLNRIVPHRVNRRLQRRLYRRDPDTVFPARYHGCWFSSLETFLRSWSEVRILPLWLGAYYFNFFPMGRSAYVAYEEWAFRHDLRNLSPYYVVLATR